MTAAAVETPTVADYAAAQAWSELPVVFRRSLWLSAGLPLGGPGEWPWTAHWFTFSFEQRRGLLVARDRLVESLELLR